MIKTVWLIVYLILLSSCVDKPIRAGKCNVWEYTNNCEEEEMTTATFSDKENWIKVPIIKHALPRKIIDSLCYKFLNDHNTKVGRDSHVEAEGFGEYYYADSLLEISIYEMNLVKDGEYSFKCYIDDTKYELSEHNSYVVIYGPRVGVVYAMLAAENIAKIGKVREHCHFSKSEWQEKYSEYLRSYLLMDCN